MIGGGLHRAAADANLEAVFGKQYGQLTMDQASLVITDLIGLDTDERINDLHRSAQVLRDRIRPATLAYYAATLEAGAQARGSARR